MIQAIINGTKTQTRRPIKVGKEFIHNYYERISHQGIAIEDRDVEKGFQVFLNRPVFDVTRWNYDMDIGPGFKVGDLLYVRETFRVKSWNNDDGWIKFEYKVDDGNPALPVYLDDYGDSITIRYMEQSTDDYLSHPNTTEDEEGFLFNDTCNPCRWRPSIHMPKEVSRITLKVTEIKAERLHDIDEAGAKAEGVEMGEFLSGDKAGIMSYRAGFANIWEGIYGNWSSNPWVWAIKFEVLKN